LYAIQFPLGSFIPVNRAVQIVGHPLEDFVPTIGQKQDSQAG
jgi:hypothetical protein